MPTIMFKKNSHPGVFEINEQHDDILNTIEMEPATTIERHLEMIMSHLRIIRKDIRFAKIVVIYTKDSVQIGTSATSIIIKEKND